MIRSGGREKGGGGREKTAKQHEREEGGGKESETDGHVKVEKEAHGWPKQLATGRKRERLATGSQQEKHKKKPALLSIWRHCNNRCRSGFGD